MYNPGANPNGYSISGYACKLGESLAGAQYFLVILGGGEGFFYLGHHALLLC